jgi:hypothetical protein
LSAEPLHFLSLSHREVDGLPAPELLLVEPKSLGLLREDFDQVGPSTHPALAGRPLQVEPKPRPCVPQTPVRQWNPLFFSWKTFLNAPAFFWT